MSILIKNKATLLKPLVLLALAGMMMSCHSVRELTRGLPPTDFTTHDLPPLDVTGSVKTIKGTYFYIDSIQKDSLRCQPGRTAVIQFDRTGHPVKFVSHYADGHLDLLYKYRYNQQGQLVYLQKSQWDKTPEIIQRFHYDEKGRIQRLKSFVWDTTVAHFQYADSHQRYIRKKYNSQGEIEQVRIIRFKHNLKKVVYENYDYLLDSTGRLTNRKNIVYRGGKMIRKKEYEDDDTGLQLYSTEETRYNKQGQWTRIHMQHLSSEETMILEKNAEYDLQGRLVKVSETLRKGDKERRIVYRFLYDDSGNWTLKKIYVNGVLRKEMQRDISYYTDGRKQS